MRFLFLLLTFISLSAKAQCDLEILGFDPVGLDMTLAVNGGFCGAPIDSVGEFLLTLTFDPPIPPAQNPFGCFDGSGNTNLLFPLDFPFVNIGEGDDETISTGDTLTFNIIEALPFGLGTSQCWQEAINSGGFDSCVVLSIQQINDSGCLDGSCEGLGGFPYPDITPENNIITFSLTDVCGGLPPPPLIGGCTDNLAINFDPLAEFDDDSCLFMDLGTNYVLIQFDCDEETLLWSFQPNLTVWNYGDVMPEEFCIEVFLENEDTPYAVECFNLSIPFDESVVISLPTYYPTTDGYDLPIMGMSFVITGFLDANETNQSLQIPDELLIYQGCIVEGCTDSNALNFNPDANVDDGSCVFPVIDVILTNLTNAGLFCDTLLGEYFIPVAYFENIGNVPWTGICATYSTSEEMVSACDYSTTNVGDEVLIVFPPIYLENDSNIQVEVVALNGQPFEYQYNESGVINLNTFDCPEGCMDENALNYNPLAETDDGSCEYPNGGNGNPLCDDPRVFIPNTFTPNNDGVNDIWQVVTEPECWDKFSLMVFNRWGNLVWETDDPEDFWMGEGYGSTHYVSDGVYVYRFEALGYNLDDWVRVNGHVTIFR